MEEKTYNLENIFSIVTCSCSVLSQITQKTSRAKTTDCSKMKVMKLGSREELLCLIGCGCGKWSLSDASFS